jgi:hypothetical protein
MHIPSVVLAAAMTASTPATKRAGINADPSAPDATETNSADRVAAPRECDTPTHKREHTREFTWVSKSFARIAAAWLRRSRPE